MAVFTVLPDLLSMLCVLGVLQVPPETLLVILMYLTQYRYILEIIEVIMDGVVERWGGGILLVFYLRLRDAFLILGLILSLLIDLFPALHLHVLALHSSSLPSFGCCSTACPRGGTMIS